MPQPFHKVLETVCLNCNLGDTPLDKSDYIKLLIKIVKNSPSDLKDMNIALVLRAHADYFNKERRLLTFMEQELGFLTGPRIF
jgi:hypothetical protein